MPAVVLVPSHSRGQTSARRDGAERAESRGHTAPARAWWCVAARRAEPPVAVAVPLRGKRRSVRTQAPVQNQFNETGNIRRRPGVRRNAVFLRQRKVKNNQPCDRWRDEFQQRRHRHLLSIGHNYGERLAAARLNWRARLFIVWRRGMVMAAIAIVRGNRRSLHRQHFRQRAVVREHQPRENRHGDCGHAKREVGADCVHCAVFMDLNADGKLERRWCWLSLIRCRG